VAVQVLEVNTPRLRAAFLEVNARLYAGDPNYIRPLDKDVEEVFDPAKNKAFRFGEAIRWILVSETGEKLGRIAAFVNSRYRTKGDQYPVGGIGFFDCINDQAAASLLFDTAKAWLQVRGMEGMDGPINFGERDRWWGLIVEGFQPPLYCMNYNKPYYRALFEGYGFQPFFDQICFGLDPTKEISQKLIDRHAFIKKDPAYKAIHIEKHQLEKFAHDFTTIYNKAWAGHGGLKEMREEVAISLFKRMKPVMDEKIVWFVYHQNDPIGFFVNIPDLNQWFKYLNGKFDWWHQLKFLFIKYTRPNRRFTGIIFGVIPEFQGKGVDAFLINEAKFVIQAMERYTYYELQWIGDFNPKMLNVAQGLGDTYPTRKLITWRYAFDRSRPVERHPIL
jgi:GNAT superfamily N-acetyltransferase